ncbi:MAG: hypothetical protein MJ166_07745 [Clostridia bacterium]|nr:hypothetical protein [Clostridia bacterium]
MFYEFRKEITKKESVNPHNNCLVAGYITVDELENAAKHLFFDHETVESCKSAKNVFRSGIEIYEDYTFTELKIIDPVHYENGDNDNTDYVSLYFKRDMLIVVDVLDTDGSTKRKFERAIKRFTPSTMTLEKLIYAFFDEILNKDVRFIEKLSLQVSAIEEDIIKGTPDEDINITLLQLKRKLLEMHNYYEQCLDIFETLDANENDIFETDSLMYIANITQRITRLREDVDSTSNAVVHLQDAYSNYLDAKLNNTMKYLTVLSTIFFPLTIIVGWYGMNFINMPELKWDYGYLYVIILSVVIMIVFALIAKKLKWFK